MTKLPWLKHGRITVGKTVSLRADMFFSLRMLRHDRHIERKQELAK